MQNWWVWTTGSKLGKSRGLSAKNWAWLELLLNRRGLRVDSRNGRGLFSKSARLKRYARISSIGSGSGGSEQIGSGSNLIR